MENKDACAFILSLLTLASSLYISGIKPYKEYVDLLKKFDNAIVIEEKIIDKMIESKTTELLNAYNEKKSDSTSDSELRSIINESFKTYINIAEQGATINVYIDSNDEGDKDLLPMQNELHQLVEKQTECIEKLTDPLLLTESNESNED